MYQEDWWARRTGGPGGLVDQEDWWTMRTDGPEGLVDYEC